MKKPQCISEIFLSSSHISKDNWHKFILLISKYIGYLQKWELIVNIEMNVVRYFILSSKKLPSTLGDTSEFILKETEIDLNLKAKHKSFNLTSITGTLIDIYDKSEIKKQQKLKQLKFSFRYLKNERYLSSTNGMFENVFNQELIVKKIVFNPPSSILSANYTNTRFFYKKKPKYLDIQKTLHLFKSESTNTILKVDTFPYLQGEYYLNQNEYNFDKHSIIIGGSGTGKSKLMSLLVNNIASNPKWRLKYKIIVIDPHAAIENDIGGLENTKVLNFLNLADSIDLFGINNEDIVSASETILSLFKALIADQYNSKMERMLRHVIYLLLTKKEFSFVNVRKVILDIEYRTELVKELTQQLPDPVIDFFLNEFNELKTRSYTETISPIISFVDEVILLPAFNNKEKMDNIEKVIKDNSITILSLNRIKLGEKSTKTIVGLALGQIMELIQTESLDEQIILMLDEISVIESPIITKFLSETRKYGLSLMLAGQYFSQISSELRNSIFANISNYYIFRVSKLDASLLTENLSIKIVDDSNPESKINLLTGLNDRECIVRVSSNGLILPAIKAKTLDFISKPRRKMEFKPVKNIIDIAPKEITTKRSFNIESKITLNELMLEQSTSRKKVR